MAASSPAANTRSLLNCTTLQAPKFAVKLVLVYVKFVYSQFNFYQTSFEFQSNYTLFIIVTEWT
jgi:hypothetical protein